MKEGLVISSLPRRSKVNQAVMTETINASIEIAIVNDATGS
jgi:hypothetical protein